jgi:hypothetical protein
MENNTQRSEIETTAGIPQLTAESAAFLLKSAKWGKFLAILGFIVTGLMVFAGILMSFVLNMLPEEMVPLNMPFSASLISIVYIVVAGIYIIPVIFLNSFSNNTIKAINQSDTGLMTTSLRNLRNLFVFVGVSTIVILSFYTILLIIIGSAAVMGF